MSIPGGGEESGGTAVHNNNGRRQQQQRRRRRHRLALGLLPVFFLIALFGTGDVLAGVLQFRHWESHTKEVATQDESTAPVTPPYQSPVSQADTFAPERVFEAYKALHSVDVLRSISNHSLDHGRTFMLGMYSCPDDVGNQIHELTSSLLLAMVTNRTLLWNFKLFHNNNRDECDQILHMASWMPSYDEWKGIYQLPTAAIIRAGDYLPTMTETQQREGRAIPFQASQVYASHPILRPKKIYHTSNHTDLWAGDILLEEPECFQFLSQLLGFENSSLAKEIIPMLYSQGQSFLYVRTSGHDERAMTALLG
jgi:hypothetical protein